MKKRNVIILRCVCIALMLFSVAISVCIRGYCWGDHVFAALGLPAWSNGSQGIHYPGIIAILLLVLSCGVFLGIWLLLVAVSKLLNLLL